MSRRRQHHRRHNYHLASHRYSNTKQIQENRKVDSMLKTAIPKLLIICDNGDSPIYPDATFDQTVQCNNRAETSVSAFWLHHVAAA